VAVGWGVGGGLAVAAVVVVVVVAEPDPGLTAAPLSLLAVQAQQGQQQAVPFCPSVPIYREIILRQPLLSLQMQENFASAQRRMLKLPGSNTVSLFSFFSPDQLRSLG